jgi:small conductance mechanosensitive channel
MKLVVEDGKLNIGDFISIKFEDLVSARNKAIGITLVIILMYFSIRIGKYIIKKFVQKQVQSNAVFSLDSQRAKTLGEVLKSVLKYSVYFIGITTIVSILFAGISGISTVTFASIGGIAVGLGAQSIIKDLINGFFILFENQYGVGDHVTLGGLTGIVKSIGIRTTVINDFNGAVHSVPNGTINGVTNHSRNNIKFVVDVHIPYEENVDNVIHIIENTSENFRKENEEYIDEPMEVAGIVELGISNVTIRVTGKAKPLSQGKMENALRKAIKFALDENKIRIPNK